jgi:hypothetical protein
MISVRSLLTKYNIHFEEGNSPEELLILCPFHKDTTVGSAFFNDIKNVFICFSCGEKGSIYDFVMKLENCSWEESVRILDAGIDYDEKKENIGKLVISGGKFDLAFKESREAMVNAITYRVLSRFCEVIPDRSLMSKWLSILTYISFHKFDSSLVSWIDIRNMYGEFLKDFKEFS